MTLKQWLGRTIMGAFALDRRTFDTIRHECRAWRTRASKTVSLAYHLRVRELRRRNDLSLNIGSGGRGLPDWVNIELTPMRDTTLCLDMRRPMPLADGSVGRILAEHVVEHMDFRADVPEAFQEWHRLLKKGGVLRIVVPDARRFLEAYVLGDPAIWRDLGWDVDDLPDDIFTPMHVINHIFHQSGEHLFAYDFETLDWALRQAGFSIVKQMSFRRSHDPQLAIDQENHAPYSLYVEAIKS